MVADPLSRVVVAISAFRSDSQVLRLLDSVFRDRVSGLAAVIVIDSLSDGTLQREIEARSWPVLYENADVNLGAAGNLARRLELAAGVDADWCFAINHDGMFDRELVATLAIVASERAKVGAIYPKRIWLNRGGTSLSPLKHVFNMPTHTAAWAVRGIEEVAWDSSNGALYGLAPVRQGVKVWIDLWHGWEDLAYGWQLSAAGWKQYLCADAVYLDDYEYQPVRLLNKHWFIACKPSWLGYYAIRNLMLIVRRTGNNWQAWTFFAKRLTREIGFIILFRDNKINRLNLLCQGFVAGLLGKTGKGSLP